MDKGVKTNHMIQQRKSNRKVNVNKNNVNLIDSRSQ